MNEIFPPEVRMMNEILPPEVRDDSVCQKGSREAKQACVHSVSNPDMATKTMAPDPALAHIWLMPCRLSRQADQVPAAPSYNLEGKVRQNRGNARKEEIKRDSAKR